MSMKSLLKLGGALSEGGLSHLLEDNNVDKILSIYKTLTGLANVRLADITADQVFELAAGHVSRDTSESVAKALNAFASNTELDLTTLFTSGQWANLLAGQRADTTPAITVFRCKSCGELNFS